MTPSEWDLEVRAGPTRILPDDSEPPSGLSSDPFDFEILTELGEGAQGRVFLAREKALGDRPIVLKLSACRGQEHLSLARLQHTHIVPLYWMRDDPERNRRTLCMPFLGTLTLADLLTVLQSKVPASRRGQDILDALDRSRDAAPVALPGEGPARAFLRQATYVQAVCWIGVCLAEALQYAHERGLVHLDVKPTNVLIAGDGQPMLLDFHLARAPILAGGPKPQGLGGTPIYMAPEHRAAMDSVMAGMPVSISIDGRADVYALGLMLYQALSGTICFALPSTRLDRVNLEVTPGLADILQRSLAPDPATRYPSASALAEDLRRHLADQPLLGVANRGWKERWRKWRRRRPHALKNYGLKVLLLIAIAGVGFFVYLNYRDRIERIEQARDLAQKHLRDKRFDDAVHSLESALSIAETTAGTESLRDELRGELTLAKRGRLLETLHDVTEDVRFAAGSIHPPGNWPALELDCGKLWKARQTVLEIAASDPAAERRARADLLDLALIWIELGSRHTASAAAKDHHLKALDVLQEAERLFGPGPVLLHEKAAHAEAIGDSTRAALARRLFLDHPPQTAWDHYSLGRTFLHRGDLKQAAANLERAVALQPENFWSNFYQGVCAFRLGNDADAVSAYRAALVALPREATVYYNRALAYARLKKMELAETDLRHALELGAEPAGAHYQLALVHWARKDRTQALASVREALRHRPDYPEAKGLEKTLEGS